MKTEISAGLFNIDVRTHSNNWVYGTANIHAARRDDVVMKCDRFPGSEFEEFFTVQATECSHEGKENMQGCFYLSREQAQDIVDQLTENLKE